jgi:hypothetical protein
MIADKLKELRSLPDEELIARHDRLSESTQVGVTYYLAEIARREQDRQTLAMIRYTKQITIMTVIITVATIINVVVAIILIFK